MSLLFFPPWMTILSGMRPRETTIPMEIPIKDKGPDAVLNGVFAQLGAE